MKFDAAIFDWAGTMIDFGSFAPMGVFVEAFATFGVTATIDEARGPMGSPKRAHIQAMMAMPSIRGQWEAKHGRAPTEADAPMPVEGGAYSPEMGHEAQDSSGNIATTTTASKVIRERRSVQNMDGKTRETHARPHSCVESLRRGEPLMITRPACLQTSLVSCSSGC